MRKLVVKSALSRNNLLDNMEKKQIKVDIENIDLYDLEGSLDRAIDILTKIKNQSKEFSNISISVEIDSDGDSLYATINIDGLREETDKEYDDRVNKVLKKELSNLIKNQKNSNIKEENVW